MASGIDPLGFLNWSMIKPENNIAIISIIGEAGAGDWHWFIGIVGKDREGTGCIEAYSADGGGIDTVLAESSLHAYADASPDVCGRLLVVAGLRLPESNIFCRHFHRVNSGQDRTGQDETALEGWVATWDTHRL
jgi:hypothetical protein